jgi:hypothetical protein
MAAKPDLPTSEAPLPVHCFDESVELDDPKPFPTWQPSPAQIAAWGPIVRAETETLKENNRLHAAELAAARRDEFDGDDDDEGI